MSAAAVEHPCDDEPETLLETANRLTEQLPGHRVEIIGGLVTVAPPTDGPHADALTTLMVPFLSAGLHGEESRVLQGIGLWLPGGPEDYAPGQQAPLPASIGAEVSLDVDEIVRAGRSKR
ncbi:hypothetical protein [Streptomyces anulatus]|uniref:hypothetical protein n=1 Tax=Streptomyces anulatus TaxID=1892 RepID=UPI001D180742|nr:hypothetical protein [Streptomyces anulatus]